MTMKFFRNIVPQTGGKFVSIILSYTTDTTAEADEILAAFTPLNTDTEAAPAE